MSEVLSPPHLPSAVLDYAAAGWQVFPLTSGGKLPAIAGGRGLHDATTDVDQLRRWWERWPAANIGLPVPEHLVVLDIDPRHGGDRTLAHLEEHNGALPPTLRQRTGGGGEHRFFLHPGGTLRNPGPGLDVRVGGRHYIVAAPSWVRQPPESLGDGRYRRVDPEATVAIPPAWLVSAMRPPSLSVPVSRPAPVNGDRPGDRFNATTTWSDVLCPAGWVPVAQRGDVTHWCRPGKRRRGTSATTTEDVLYVFSTEAAPFEPERPYDRFGAFAALHHHGDLAAAARALRASV